MIEHNGRSLSPNHHEWRAGRQAWARRPTILLAERDDSVRCVLGSLLSHDGYDVVEAESGNDAIVALQERAAREASTRPVDLLLTEARQQGGSGLLLVEKIRLAGWTIPAILLAAQDDLDVLAASKRLNAPVLLKPVTVDALRRLVLRTLAACLRPPPAEPLRGW